MSKFPKDAKQVLEFLKFQSLDQTHSSFLDFYGLTDGDYNGIDTVREGIYSYPTQR